MSEQTEKAWAHEDAQVAKWAEDPSRWGEPSGTLRGAEAAAVARKMLEDAGLDVAALERRVGRPRLGERPAARGTRSPRVNVAVPAETHEALSQAARQRHVRPSVIVREALDAYLRPAG